jgi:hypothetical protein
VRALENLCGLGVRNYNNMLYSVLMMKRQYLLCFAFFLLFSCSGSKNKSGSDTGIKRRTETELKSAIYVSKTRMEAPSQTLFVELIESGRYTVDEILEIEYYAGEGNIEYSNRLFKIFVETLNREITSLTILGPPDFNDFSPLLELKSLRNMEIESDTLTDSNLKGISVLAELENLTSLKIQANKITDLSPLSALVNLKELTLVSENIADLSALLPLVNLEKLYFYNAYSQSITDISRLGGLETLVLRFNSAQIKVDIAPLQNLVNLKVLAIHNYKTYFDFQKQYEELDITPLGYLFKLEDLYIGSFTVNDLSVLLYLPNLVKIDLQDAKIDEYNDTLLRNSSGAEITTMWDYLYMEEEDGHEDYKDMY